MRDHTRFDCTDPELAKVLTQPRARQAASKAEPTKKTQGQVLFELCLIEGVCLHPQAWVNLRHDSQTMWERIAAQFKEFSEYYG